MIILISGKQRAGKDTLADGILANQRRIPSFEIHRMSFAEPIKQIHDSVRRTMSQYTGGLDLTKTKPDRRLMQLIGTEWGREVFGPEVWINALKERMMVHHRRYVSMQGMRDRILQNNALAGAKDAKLPVPLFVISDCRFPDEFEAFPEALRVRIECQRDIRKLRDTENKWGDETHRSETALDDYSINKRFDLYLDSGSMTAQGMVELTLAQLLKGSWPEKRGRYDKVDEGRGSKQAVAEEAQSQ